MQILVCVLALCATVFAAPSPRIVGGSDADRGQFPYQVSLQFCLLGFCQHSCGGSIISPSWIVTAGHCITEASSLGSYHVLAGILNLNDTNPERQSVTVRETIVHPDYKGGVNPNDIALLKLSSPLLLGDQIKPIALPAQDQDSQGTSVLSGWGSMGGVLFPRMSNTLQKVDIPIVQINECKLALDKTLGGDHPLDLTANVCSGPLTGGVSACSGDSGGPLAQDGHLIGIVSWGIVPCGSVGAPSVYTKASHYIDWIKQHVDEQLL